MNATGQTRSSSFRPEHFGTLRAVEDRHFWFVSRRESVLRSLVRFSEAGEPLKVLEVGCGTGSVLRYLRRGTRWSLVGADVHREALRLCQAGLNVPLVLADALRLPFRDSWDVIAILDVIEHLDQDEAVLRECGNALKQGGKLIVTVPAFPLLWSSFDELACHKRRYRRAELAAKLGRAGFRIERVTYFMLSLFPLVYVFRRFRDRVRGNARWRDCEVPGELLIPPLINTPLRLLLRLEGRLLQHTDLPFGTSLLAVAVKA